jgi:subtilisin family serine protease
MRFVVTNQFRLPDDIKNTLAKEQWWLFNSGQGVTNNNDIKQGTPGIDINVLPLWPQYTGKGIKVGVIDDNFDTAHEDFPSNFDPSLSQNNLGGSNLKADTGAHGTAVAGIIAARKNNLGTVGIAYEATIGAYTYDNSLESLQAQAKFDVSNNSWGTDPLFDPKIANELVAIKNVATTGRGGLGTVLAFGGETSARVMLTQTCRQQNSGGEMSMQAIMKAVAM